MSPDGIRPYPGESCLYVYRRGEAEAVFSRHEGGITLLGYASPPGGSGLTWDLLRALRDQCGPIEVYDPVEYDRAPVAAFWQAALTEGLIATVQDGDGLAYPLPVPFAEAA
jgi:hypothetical protein